MRPLCDCFVTTGKPDSCITTAGAY